MIVAKGSDGARAALCHARGAIGPAAVDHGIAVVGAARCRVSRASGVGRHNATEETAVNETLGQGAEQKRQKKRRGRGGRRNGQQGWHSSRAIVAAVSSIVPQRNLPGHVASLVFGEVREGDVVHRLCRVRDPALDGVVIRNVGSYPGNNTRGQEEQRVNGSAGQRQSRREPPARSPTPPAPSEQIRASTGSTEEPAIRA